MSSFFKSEESHDWLKERREPSLKEEDFDQYSILNFRQAGRSAKSDPRNCAVLNYIKEHIAIHDPFIKLNILISEIKIFSKPSSAKSGANKTSYFEQELPDYIFCNL